MIRYEELPKAAQKTCNLTNKVRIAVLFIGYAIVAMLYIFFIKDRPESVFEFLCGPIFAGGMLSGIVHGEFVYKKIMKTLLMFGILGLFVERWYHYL